MAKAMTKSKSPLSKKPEGLNTIIDAIDDEIAISRGIECVIGGLEVLDEGARGGVKDLIYLHYERLIAVRDRLDIMMKSSMVAS